MPFSAFGLTPALLNTLNIHSYFRPFPIQQEAIPAIMNGKDVLGIAKTGAGKTASYVLPILTRLQGDNGSKNRHINTLILVPTRELAIQINEVFRLFSADLPKLVKSLAVYGGVSINPQMMDLQGVNVLVATPGRLLELVDNNAVHLSSIQTLVLDEADKMLNLGFKDELDRLFTLLPKKRQNLLFSATLSSDLSAVHQVLLQDPVLIKIDLEEELNIDSIQQLAYFVSEEKKGPLLRHLITSQEMKQVLVFTSSVKRADNVATKLRANGIDAMSIHSKKTQGVRTNLLTKFKHNKIRVLVATDLLARGIDIELLPHVINYELPRSPKDYVHRIGRTGRADSQGEAISLVSPEEQDHFRIIQKKMGKIVTRVAFDETTLKGY
ncbi:MAG: DEAD/DEAH box helicase [Prolixibacteraceae bacterium]